MRIRAPFGGANFPFDGRFSPRRSTQIRSGREHDLDKIPALPIARPGRGRQNRGARPDRHNQPQKARGWLAQFHPLYHQFNRLCGISIDF
jgi:hypothetical protein